MTEAISHFDRHQVMTAAAMAPLTPGMHRVREDLYWFHPVDGGEVYFLVTPEGLLMIDASFLRHRDAILAGLREYNLDPRRIILGIATHIHADHAGGLGWWAQEFGFPVLAHEVAAVALESADPISTYATLPYLRETFVPCPVARRVRHGECVEINGVQLAIEAAPGHTDSGIHVRCGEYFFVGDTLFADGAIGWIDVHWGSNPDDYLETLQRMRPHLGTLTLAGHGAPYVLSETQIARGTSIVSFYVPPSHGFGCPRPPSAYARPEFAPSPSATAIQCVPEEPVTLCLREHLGRDWEAHAVSFPLPQGTTLGPDTPVQVRDLTYGHVRAGQIDETGRVHFLTDLWADEERRFAVTPVTQPLQTSLVVSEEHDEFILNSGRMAVALSRLNGSTTAPPPVRWLTGPQGLQRGQSAWAPGVAVQSAHSRLIARGPVFAEVEMHYAFVNGSTYDIRVRVFTDAPLALVHEEKSTGTAGAWTLSLYEGFTPDTVQLGFADGQIWPVTYTDDGHLCRHIFFNHMSQYQDFKDISCLYRSDANRDGDALGLFPMAGDTWENFAENWITLDTLAEGPDVRYTFRLEPGRRAFALFALRQSETRVRRRSDFTYGKFVVGNAGTGVYALRARWDLCRLDAIKEMTLVWDHPAGARTFFTDPARMAAARARMAVHPEFYRQQFEADALFAGNPASVTAMKQVFFYHLELMRDDAIEFGPNACNVNPVFFRPLAEFPFYYEVLMMRGAFTPAEEAKARAIMVFLAEFTASENYYFGRSSLLPDDHPGQIMSLYKGMRSENFGTDRFVAFGQIGAAFPEHPASAHWRAVSRELFDLQLQQLVGACGNWCEGVTYARWAIQLLTHYALAVHDLGEDWLADPRFKNLYRFLIGTLSPRNPVHGGKRTAPAYGSYGDTEYVRGFSSLLAMMATAWQHTDPQLSAELMWAYHEMGDGPFHALHGPDLVVEADTVALFTDFTLPASPPVLTSRGLPDFGGIFRHRLDDGRETCLIARASRFWPHGHVDAGSFFLYWRDIPLVTEAGRGLNEAAALLDTNGKVHNIIRFDDCDPFKYDWPCRQGLAAFAADGDLEYFVLDCRVEKLLIPGRRPRGHGDLDTRKVNIRYFRHFLFLKPDIFVVYDVFSPSECASEFRLHCLADSVAFTGSSALFTGRYGVDLEVAVLSPAAPAFSTTRVLDTCSVEFHQAPGAPILTVLTPFEHGERPDITCTFRDGLLTVRRDGVSRQVRFLPTSIPEIAGFSLG